MAQATAQVSGTVVDPTGAVVPTIKVTIKNLGTNAERLLSTNNEGLYSAANLQPGSYSVSAVAAGFQPLHRQCG